MRATSNGYLESGNSYDVGDGSQAIRPAGQDIRYCEEIGFIRPWRANNGCRNYLSDDITGLLSCAARATSAFHRRLPPVDGALLGSPRSSNRSDPDAVPLVKALGLNSTILLAS